MKKIRVLEVVGSMDMGGAETFLMNVLRNIDKNKYQLYFLVYGSKHFDYEDELEKLGGIIVRVKKPKKIFDLRLIYDIKNIIVKNSISVVHAHTNHNSAYAVLAARRANIKSIIVHSHTTLPEQTNILKKVYYRITKYIINKYSTVFLACGKEAGESLFDKRNAFQIINNGIIVEDFKYSITERRKKRKELNIAKDTVALVHIGRIDRNKNHKYLIDIFRTFSESVPNSALFIIGDGVLRKKVLEQIDKYNLDDKVFLLGKRPDVNKLLSAMDVLVFPSMYEGLPVTLIEAQVNGIPIVASSNIDKDSNYTGSIVFLSINLPCDKWANAIKEEMNKRYNNYDNLVSSRYNIKNVVNEIERIYEAL